MNISKLANPKFKETKHDQHKSTRDTNTKSELSINTIKGIQADLNELFKEKENRIYI